MSIEKTLICTLALTTSLYAFAQTTETNAPDGGISGAINSAIAEQSPGSKAMDQAEILTDTMGVDFGPYLKEIVPIVKQNWYKIMPPSVYPPFFKKGRLAIEFVIQKDGSVSGLVRDTTSCDLALDRAAWGSITTSAPFPPLPKEFPGKLLGLRFYYFYNLKPTDFHMSISPCGDVRVPAGSTQQFSASGKGIMDKSVTWTVSGIDCSKSACGTISNAGLYTAPGNVPDPPTVYVEATLLTDNRIRANTKLTVVRPNPAH